MSVRIVILILINTVVIDAAKILGVFTFPSVSHQVVFNSLTQELVRRGHEVTVVTPNPVFPKGKGPTNLIEIDVHDVSYELWQRIFSMSKGKSDDLTLQINVIFEALNSIFEAQMLNDEVKKVINRNEQYDLVIIEASMRPVLAISHIIKAPLIKISSFGSVFDDQSIMGSATHRLLYPEVFCQKQYNLTMLEKLNMLYNDYIHTKNYNSLLENENKMVKKIFGNDTLPLNELKKNVDMLFLNVHPIWDNNRPVPPSVVYVGFLNETPKKELPQDLKTYLDSSKNGVIYASFGTNIKPSLLPPEKIQMILEAFSKLPYDVLFKWDEDKLPEEIKNVKISKWFPQADVLRHPNIKVFITQGGLQSTDEAIKSGVPLIGVPMLTDQWYNTEKYLHHKIGLRLYMDKLDAETLIEAIKKVIEDNSYRRNVIKLRSIMNDLPQKPMERAVWWTEYVLRHGGAKHLHSPAANISLAEYLELELIIYTITLLLLSGMVVILFLFICLKFIFKNLNKKFKKS